jgi:hypothetical protein
MIFSGMTVFVDIIMALVELLSAMFLWAKHTMLIMKFREWLLELIDE